MSRESTNQKAHTLPRRSLSTACEPRGTLYIVHELRELCTIALSLTHVPISLYAVAADAVDAEVSLHIFARRIVDYTGEQTSTVCVYVRMWIA